MTSEERLAAAEAHIADLAAVVDQQREQIAQQRAYIRKLEGRGGQSQEIYGLQKRGGLSNYVPSSSVVP